MKASIRSFESLAPADTLGRRLNYAVGDIVTITGRAFLHWRRQPGVVLIGWLFPVMIVLMFGFLFGGAIRVPVGGNYFEFLMPGMFALTMVFGLESTMIAVSADASKGVTDRFRSMPMNASAILLGRCIADTIHSIVGLGVLIGSGLLLGWRWHDGLDAMLAAIALLLLLRFAMLWAGIYMGLAAKGPESVAAIQILVWPFGFLSSVFVEPSTMPVWLGTIAEWNPLSATAAATRQLFMNPGWQADSWAAQHAIEFAVIWPVLITAVFLPLSIVRYRRLKR
ncbi:ABC transporter permease [Paenibacillus alkalitolerans]|uniref:ABC transporter permease n=1 Tax=Paenibacillus alkalitolerans TaxID=2799335 RepID=UPI0018F667B6|nr:ABC transporter permease [Paenibacillus alkalitolerans]